MAGGRRTPDHPRVVTLAAGSTLWRVSKALDGLAFSSWSGRLNRFSPVRDTAGDVVPAWYGGSTQAGAIFESVFHDLRPSQAAPRAYPNAYLDRILAPVTSARDLLLVDLTTVGLHAIGTSRAALIESTSSRYAWTISIAERLRRAEPSADGFVWVSRANDTSQSVVLHADAGRAPLLGPHGSLMPVALGAGTGLRILRELATEAKITLVVPDRG